jgi:cytochrome oxidase assembly protein ShyY1
MERLEWKKTLQDAVEAKAHEKGLEIDLLKRRI